MLKYAKGSINMKYICTLSHKFDSRIEITIYVCMLQPWNGSMTTAKDSSGLP